MTSVLDHSFGCIASKSGFPGEKHFALLIDRDGVLARIDQARDDMSFLSTVRCTPSGIEGISNTTPIRFFDGCDSFDKGIRDIAHIDYGRSGIQLDTHIHGIPPAANYRHGKNLHKIYWYAPRPRKERAQFGIVTFQVDRFEATPDQAVYPLSDIVVLQ